MLFSLLKRYLDLYISDTATKVSWSLYCFTTSICHGVENYFPRLWGTGISDAIFQILNSQSFRTVRNICSYPGEATTVVFLDQSAASDPTFIVCSLTVGSSWFPVCGVVLEWFKSYLLVHQD